MSSEQIMKILQSKGINSTKFSCLDYISAFEELNLEGIYLGSKKKKIVEKFMNKYTEQQQLKILNRKRKKQSLFLKRMETTNQIKTQRIENLRFLVNNYDMKANQLLFHPKINKNFGAQKGSVWKDSDGFQKVEVQQIIIKPNISIFKSNN